MSKGLYSLSESPAKEEGSTDYQTADLDKKEFNLPLMSSPSISPDPPRNPPPLLKKLLPKNRGS